MPEAGTIAALLAAATGVLGWWGGRQKARVDLGRDLFEQVGKLRDACIKKDADNDELRGKLAERDREIGGLRARVARLEAAVPLALAAERLEDRAGGLAAVLDRLSDPVVITSPARGGMFLWCNRSMADALRMPREQILAATWQQLVHPEDLRETEAAEAAAWDQPVEGHVNRYQRSDGAWIRFRWYSAEYRHGVALAVARNEGVASSPPTGGSNYAPPGGGEPTGVTP